MLAAMKLGLVVIPAMPQLGESDIADQLERGRAKFLVAHGRDAEKFAELGERVERIAVGEAPEGWRSYASLVSPNPRFLPDGPTRADDPMLVDFGTSARPKRIVHSHASTTIGHLSTMYGLGLKPGRRAPRHFLAGPGAARLRIRALERRRDRDRARRPLRAASRARCARRSSGDHVLCAPLRLAHADPRKSRPMESRPSGDRFVGRTVGPGADR